MRRLDRGVLIQKVESSVLDGLLRGRISLCCDAVCKTGIHRVELSFSCIDREGRRLSSENQCGVRALDTKK